MAKLWKRETKNGNSYTISGIDRHGRKVFIKGWNNEVVVDGKEYKEYWTFHKLVELKNVTGNKPTHTLKEIITVF